MIITTYDRLNVFLDRWITGAIDLLIIESGAGLAKTSLARERLKGIPHLAINSHVTPLEMYKQLYKHKDELVWFDDVTLLLFNPIQVSLLKQVCDTHKTKILSYFTTSDLIEDVPNKFFTESRVLITCNSIEAYNPHILAIKDRGFFLRFEPTREEILAKMREVTKNYPLLTENEKLEVLNFIEQHSKNVRKLSLRFLVKGFQLYNYWKLKGVDWQEDLLKELGISEKLIVMNELLTNYDNDQQRLAHWNYSRASFYNYKQIAEV